MALSKKQRFDVFKRDSFICQYCGRSPPAVVLEVDHVTPVSKGGTDVPHNLLTSCFDCNRGKAAGSLQPGPLNTKEKSDLLAERMAQSKAYDRLLRRERDRLEGQVATVHAIFQSHFNGRSLTANSLASVRRFCGQLPATEVESAMESSCVRFQADRAFKYFCGICWKKIKGSHG